MGCAHEKMNEVLRTEIGDYTPLTLLAMRAFRSAKVVSPVFWLSKWCPLLRSRNELSPEELFSQDATKKRVKAVELYIITWLAIEVVLVGLVCFFELPSIIRSFLAVVAGLRIVEVFQVTVNAAFFDSFSSRSDNMVASSPRIIVLAFYNFIELAVCFGVIYALYFRQLHGAGRPATSFYFSVVTQLTIGYGDIYPMGYLRIVTAAQGLISVVFVVLVIARFVSILPRMRSLLDEPQSGDTTLGQEGQSHNISPQGTVPASKINPMAKLKSHSQQTTPDRVGKKNNSKRQRPRGPTPK